MKAQQRTVNKTKKPTKGRTSGHATDEISVLVAGFPKETKRQDVMNYVSEIAPFYRSTIIKSHKNTFRGFQFIHFKSMKDAKNFVGKNYYFEGKQLDCKVSINHDDFTCNSLQNVREPKKVVAENLSVNISKNEVKQLFSRFGKVEEVILTPTLGDMFHNAFVTFYSYKSAKDCTQEKQILFDDNKIIDVKFAKPKFSSYMLRKTDPIQTSYIFMIMKERINFDPADFAYQQDNVMKSEDSKLLLKQFYAQKFQIYENYLYKETEEGSGENELTKKVIVSDEKLINVTDKKDKLDIIFNMNSKDDETTEILDSNQVSKALENEATEIHDGNQASNRKKSTVMERSSEEYLNSILDGPFNVNPEKLHPEVITPQSKIPKKKDEKKNLSSKKKDLICVLKDDKKINKKKVITSETYNINKESNAFPKDTKKKAKHLDNIQCIKPTIENKLLDNQKDSQQDDKDMNIDANAVNFQLNENCIEEYANKELENLKETGINNLARENLLLKDELLRMREKYGEEVKDSNGFQDAIPKNNKFDCYDGKIPSSLNKKGYPTYDENGKSEQYVYPQHQNFYSHIPNYQNHENTFFQNTNYQYQNNGFLQNNNTPGHFSDNSYYYPEMYYNQQTPQYYHGYNNMHYSDINYNQREPSTPDYDTYNYYSSNGMNRDGEHTQIFDSYGYPLHNDPSSVDMNTCYGYKKSLENLKKDEYLAPEMKGQYEINSPDSKNLSDIIIDAHNNPPLKETGIKECKVIDNQNGYQKLSRNPQNEISTNYDLAIDLNKLDGKISNSWTGFSLF